MTKIPPKNTKLTPLFSPQKIRKKALKKTDFFCIFGIIFVFLGGFLFYLGDLCIICIFWGIFAFLGGFFNMTLYKMFRTKFFN
jgi:hypothetical protein